MNELKQMGQTLRAVVTIRLRFDGRSTANSDNVISVR